MIDKKTLVFYGLSEELADLVINNKLKDDMKEKIVNLHNYNVVFIYGDEIDKDFIIGKITQLYLQNEQKVLITDLPNLEYMFDNDIPTPDYARIIIIRNINIITQKQVGLMRMLPYIFKKKTFIIDADTKTNPTIRAIKDGLLWSIKIKELEV